MIWIIVGVIVFALYKFFSAVKEDAREVSEKPVSDKFFIIVDMINDVAFNGNGQIFAINHSEFNLYQEGSNQIIQFSYSLGGLVIIWKYKYFQKEVIHTEAFENVRNISLPEQEIMANRVISKAQAVIKNHRDQIDALSFQVDRERIERESEDVDEREARRMFDYLQSQRNLTALELLENAMEKIKSENYEGALRDLKRGIAKAEMEEVSAYHQLEAVCYFKGGDYESALTAIDMAISKAKSFMPAEITYLSKLNETRLKILSEMNGNDKPW